jgi:hypothetical protein
LGLVSDFVSDCWATPSASRGDGAAVEVSVELAADLVALLSILSEQMLDPITENKTKQLFPTSRTGKN